MERRNLLALWSREDALNLGRNGMLPGVADSPEVSI